MGNDEILKHLNNNNRRHFLKKLGLGIGGLALGSMLDPRDILGSQKTIENIPLGPSSLSLPHFAPKAKRVIYLFQSGGPSQLDLFDYKPKLTDLRGQDLPESVQVVTSPLSNMASLELG